MKKCVKCKELKDFSEFHKNRTEPDGYQKLCKQCRKNHYNKNKSIILEKRKNYYYENKDIVLQQQKQYYKKNQERIKKRVKQYSKKANISYVLFKTFQPQLQPYGIKCRHALDDENILEVRCYKCKKWFKPLRISVVGKIQNIKGQTSSPYNLYCSDDCKKNCCEYGLSPQTIERNIKIEKGLFDDKLFHLYKSIVVKLTRKEYKKHKDKINSDNLPRGKGLYHLDHKYSIYDGFNNNILPTIISSYKNLQLIPQEINLKKGKTSSILLEELI